MVYFIFTMTGQILTVFGGILDALLAKTPEMPKIIVNLLSPTGYLRKAFRPVNNMSALIGAILGHTVAGLALAYWFSHYIGATFAYVYLTFIVYHIYKTVVTYKK